mmetsp:Transcript_13179/g.32033  ORF Transcript_13179/g.32033 Transcript_13179/m.32033 type:complete len:99 (+) Transcript_13179:466-762(+)
MLIYDCSHSDTVHLRLAMHEPCWDSEWVIQILHSPIQLGSLLFLQWKYISISRSKQETESSEQNIIPLKQVSFKFEARQYSPFRSGGDGAFKRKVHIC